MAQVLKLHQLLKRVAAPVVAPQEVTAAPAVPQASCSDCCQCQSSMLKYPDIGEDGEVDVIEVLVAVGDVIELKKMV